MPKTFTVLINSAIAIIAPIKIMIYGLLFLIFVDLITGIRKNHHIKGFSLNPFKVEFWKAIKSNSLRQTWRKTYEYFIGILIAIVFENMIFGTISIEMQEKTFTLVKMAIIVSAAIEMWSIFENMEAVTGRNILKRIMSFLPEKIQNLFKNE
jgi:hypothetical protein